MAAKSYYDPDVWRRDESSSEEPFDEVVGRRTRTKYFFFNNFHLRLDIRKDGRLDEIAFCAVTFATKVEGSTFLLAYRDIFHNAL